MALTEKLTAIADAIRGKTGGAEALTLDQMPGEVDNVYEAGKKTEYDVFWNMYQDYGKRLDYSNAFAGVGWTTEMFKPKYDIRPNNAYMMFRSSGFSGDLAAALEALGVELDVSAATNTQYIFYSCTSITRIGALDVRSSTNSIPLDTAFNQCSRLVTIDKIYLTTGKTGEFSATFNGCTDLENITFDGTITANGLDTRWSKKLSKTSIENIIGCLSDISSSQTITFSITAVNTAFETTPGAADGSTSEEWITLIATKPNWTIALADA